MNIERLKEIAKLLRYYILVSSTEAGSGHPTSSLSAVELMTALMFSGIYKYDLDNIDHPNNDRLIFSKGHASPLFYSLYTASRKISEKELMSYRNFGSKLEGHPTLEFSYTEAATGSLGQGLSVGVGMAINAKYLDKLPYKTYVLLGDSEMAEGSQWEAIQIAAYYGLNNLIGIIDVNRLGQRGETMYGHDINALEKRVGAFGWDTYPVDGHSLTQVIEAYEKALASDRPAMVIAKTLKGKGVSLVEDKDSWHGKALNKEQLKEALSEIGEVDKKVCGEVALPKDLKTKKVKAEKIKAPDYNVGDMVATRKAYGETLVRIYLKYPEMVVLDAEVSNSTYAEIFKKENPEKYFEMFIAEQNMVGTAIGLSKRNKIPFVSTFAAFFTRAFDQIRMSQYSKPNIKFAGSHTGVSIGEDGFSQMGLSDIAIFRSLHNSVVLYPSDAVCASQLIDKATDYKDIVYFRLTRKETPVIYKNDEKFELGGSKTLKKSDEDEVTVIGAGVTLFEALKAYDELKKEGILIRVIDLYSVKPIDKQALLKAVRETKAIFTVEDHHAAGGLGEAVASTLATYNTPLFMMAVRKAPKSGKPDQLLDYEEISKDSIVERIKELINNK